MGAPSAVPLGMAAVCLLGCAAGPQLSESDETDETVAWDSVPPEEPCPEPPPAYPAGPYGWLEGEVIGPAQMPGAAPAWGIDGEVGTNDFFLESDAACGRKTTLLILIDTFDHHAHANPNCSPREQIPVWERLYGERGLALWTILVNHSYDSASALVSTFSSTTAWGADGSFQTAALFPEDMTIDMPAFAVVDLCSMEILASQEGCAGPVEALFLPHLDRECP